MNYRKYMLLIVGGAVCLVLLIGALFVLFRYVGEYTRVTAELDSRQQRMDQLHQRDPYPSEENVTRADGNLHMLREFVDRVLETVRRGQVEERGLERAAFRQLLDTTLVQLTRQAREQSVILPAAFPFGFDRYQQGAQPEPKNIPRLTVQLQTIDRLCRLLYEAKVAEVAGMTREVFDEAETLAPAETDPNARRQGRFRAGQQAPGAPVAAAQVSPAGDPSKVVSREVISITFTAREPSLWALLNALARDPMFTVVKAVELTNEKREADGVGAPMRVLPTGPGALPGAPAGPQVGADGLVQAPVTVDRTVAGRERIKVKLTIAVYRLIEPPKPEAA